MQETEAQQACPYCSREQSPENAYCIYCGSRLGSRSHTVAEDLTDKKPQASLAHSGTLHCPRCGGTNRAENSLCGWCEIPLPWAKPDSAIVPGPLLATQNADEAAAAMSASAATTAATAAAGAVPGGSGQAAKGSPNSQAGAPPASVTAHEPALPTNTPDAAVPDAPGVSPPPPPPEEVALQSLPVPQTVSQPQSESEPGLANDRAPTVVPVTAAPRRINLLIPYFVYFLPAFLAGVLLVYCIALMQRPNSQNISSSNDAAGSAVTTGGVTSTGAVAGSAAAAPPTDAVTQAAQLRTQQTAQNAVVAAQNARRAEQDAATARAALQAAKTGSPANSTAVADAQKRAADAVAELRKAQDRADAARADATAARAENDRLQAAAAARAAALPLPAAGQPDTGAVAGGGDETTATAPAAPAAVQPANGLVVTLASPNDGTVVAASRGAGAAGGAVGFTVPVTGSVTDHHGNNVSKSYRANLYRAGLQISTLYADLRGPGDNLLVQRTPIQVYSDSTFNSTLSAGFTTAAGIAGTYKVRVFGSLTDAGPLAENNFTVTAP